MKILDSETDCDEWDRVVGAIQPDLYFSSAWHSLHGQGRLFVFEEGGRVLAYPFLLKAIETVAGEDVSDEGLSDIESAYGYGGPVANSEDAAFLTDARSAFESWCTDHQIVSEFIRFHPLCGSDRYIGKTERPVTIFDDRLTVSVATDGFIDDAVPYSKDAAYMVRRARRAGAEAQVVREPSDEQYADFVQMYKTTMESIGAAEFYFFDDCYFEKLRTLINTAGFLVNAVTGDGSLAGSSAYLAGSDFLHYHLSGSSRERLPGVGNLMIDAAAREAAAMGLERLHLGGGTTSDEKDSLFKFKRSLGTDTHQFRLGKCVHLPDAYEDLLETWRRGSGQEESNRLQRYRD